MSVLRLQGGPRPTIGGITEHRLSLNTPKVFVKVKPFTDALSVLMLKNCSPLVACSELSKYLAMSCACLPVSVMLTSDEAQFKPLFDVRPAARSSVVALSARFPTWCGTCAYKAGMPFELRHACKTSDNFKVGWSSRWQSLAKGRHHLTTGCCPG